MNPGRLNHRIELQAYTSTDVNGFPVKDWQSFATVWAEKIPVSQREYFSAAAIQQENIVRWRIRWRKPPANEAGKPLDWQQDCRVLDKETQKVYEITGVDDGGGKRELILITREVAD